MAPGAALLLDGAIIFFVMPKVVNNGSGQDAVDLFATFGGGGARIAGLMLLALGAALRPKRET